MKNYILVISTCLSFNAKASELFELSARSVANPVFTGRDAANCESYAEALPASSADLKRKIISNANYIKKVAASQSLAGELADLNVQGSELLGLTREVSDEQISINIERCLLLTQVIATPDIELTYPEELRLGSSNAGLGTFHSFNGMRWYKNTFGNRNNLDDLVIAWNLSSKPQDLATLRTTLKLPKHVDLIETNPIAGGCAVQSLSVANESAEFEIKQSADTCEPNSSFLQKRIEVNSDQGFSAYSIKSPGLAVGDCSFENTECEMMPEIRKVLAEAIEGEERLTVTINWTPDIKAEPVQFELPTSSALNSPVALDPLMVNGQRSPGSNPSESKILGFTINKTQVDPPITTDDCEKLTDAEFGSLGLFSYSFGSFGEVKAAFAGQLQNTLINETIEVRVAGDSGVRVCRVPFSWRINP